MSATPAATLGRPPKTGRSRCRRLALVMPLVLVATAAVLRGLDAMPALLRGEPRGVQRYARLEAFERDVRTQLLLPFYFPDFLAWPPDAIYWAAGDRRPTSVVILDRASRAPRLVIAQCLDGACDIPARLLPPGRELERQPVEISGHEGEWIRRLGPGDVQWTDLRWQQEERQIVVRMIGEETDLERIARSFRRGRP